MLLRLASNFWAQIILLPQPPKVLGSQAWATMRGQSPFLNDINNIHSLQKTENAHEQKWEKEKHPVGTHIQMYRSCWVFSTFRYIYTLKKRPCWSHYFINSSPSNVFWVSYHDSASSSTPLSSHWPLWGSDRKIKSKAGHSGSCL